MKIDIRDFDISKCFNAEEFYKTIGLTQYFHSKQITDVRQMKMDIYTYDYVLKVLQGNSKRNKGIKYLKPEKQKQAVSFDWSNYSPMIDNNVEPYIIMCELNEIL